MIDRVHRELTEDDIARIADTYHAWRGDLGSPTLGSPSTSSAEADAEQALGDPRYEDVPGFCKAATLDEIRQHNHILTPGRYVGMGEVEEDDEPFEEKMGRLMAQLEAQFTEGARLEAAIRENLGWLWGTEP